jgi:hypothetical protein
MLAFARWVSIVLHPFVVVGLMVASVAAARGGRRGLLSSLGLVAAFVVVPLAILMIRQVRKGSWENVDASRPSERPVLFGVVLGGLALLVGFLAWRDPGSFFLRGTAVSLAALLLCAALTPFVKISLHIVLCALAATMLALMGSPVGWLLLAALPVLMWSRVVMGRHRVVEVMLGAVVGAAAGAAVHLV